MNIIEHSIVPASNLDIKFRTAIVNDLRPTPGSANAGQLSSADGLSASFWMNGSEQLKEPATAGYRGGSSASNGQGGFMGLINNLIDQLGAFINSLNAENTAEGAGTQSVANAAFTSTGDPHLGETGTILDASGNSSAVDRHFDSMTGHDNLLSSQEFSGGYRLSSSVTAPNAQGVTLNHSATVHLNGNQDNITLNADGSASITSDGNSVVLAAGQTATLAGGENVTRNTDGSLLIAVQSIYGGTISTSLVAAGGGVNATANVRNAEVGGDIAGGIVTPVPQRLQLESKAASGFA